MNFLNTPGIVFGLVTGVSGALTALTNVPRAKECLLTSLIFPGVLAAGWTAEKIKHGTVLAFGNAAQKQKSREIQPCINREDTGEPLTMYFGMAVLSGALTTVATAAYQGSVQLLELTR